MTALLEIDGVTKRFGGLTALDQCTFGVEAGSATCLVGPNGAGKTTVFDVITGLLKPNAGSVRLEGETITGLDRRTIVKKGVARTFQNLRIYGEMTVLDNVLVSLCDEDGNGPIVSILRPFHAARAFKRKSEAAMELLRVVGLDHKAHDLAGQCSYGQQKLLCIARVLATEADLLMLDEPTSGLAAGALAEMVALIDRLRGLDKTLLIVEHNTQIVKQISSQVVFMHQGQVLADGAPDDVLSQRHLIDIYFGGAIEEVSA